jgi:hypothetical protein
MLPRVFTPIRTERLVVRPWREDEAPRLLGVGDVDEHHRAGGDA